MVQPTQGRPCVPRLGPFSQKTRTFLRPLTLFTFCPTSVSRFCPAHRLSAGSRQRGSVRIRCRKVLSLRVNCVSSQGNEALQSSSKSSSVQGRQGGGAARPVDPAASGNGVFWLLLCNAAMFFLDHVLHQRWIQQLYLFNARPRWWQFITCSFCHSSLDHLSGNLFLLYVFGRIVEEEEGAGGVWGTYLICGVGASLATLLLSAKNTVSLGASGSVFGLFTMAVLCKFRPSIKKLLECVILGQFVFKQVAQEVQAQAAQGAGLGAHQVAGVQVGHIAHIAGALAGVALVALLSRLPAAASIDNPQSA